MTLVVEHLLDGRVDTATLRRERIAIPGVPYAGWVADGIGYVQHSDFTEGATTTFGPPWRGSRRRATCGG